MFDFLPETRKENTHVGKGAVSTSVVAHGGLLVAIVAISMLTRVGAGEPPPIPINWVMVIAPTSPKLGDSLDAGGRRQPPKATHRADQPAEKPPMEQPSVAPDHAASSAMEPPPEPSSVSVDFESTSGLDTSALPGGGGGGSGSGEGPGDGPGSFGVRWGDRNGQGTGGASENPDEILYVVGDVEEPRLLKRFEPEYPRIAISARVQGTVILEGVIGTTGRIESLRVLRSVPLLDDAALRAVGQWRYTPARRGGVPVKVYLTIRVEFRFE